MKRNEDKRDIQTEVTNILVNFFRDQTETLDKMDLMSRYQFVNETATFLYEGYRNNYEMNIMVKYDEPMTDEQLAIEGLIFTSSITIGVLKQLEGYIENMTKPIVIEE